MSIEERKREGKGGEEERGGGMGREGQRRAGQEEDEIRAYEDTEKQKEGKNEKVAIKIIKKISTK